MSKKSRRIPTSILVLLFSSVMVLAAILFIRHFFLEKEDPVELEPAVSRARIVYLHGKVRVKKADRVDWKEAEANEVLSEDDKVKTWENSTASIEFENGSLMNVKENSLVVITELMSNDTSIEVLSGRVSAQVEELNPDQNFRIKAKLAEAKVLHEESSMD